MPSMNDHQWCPQNIAPTPPPRIRAPSQHALGAADTATRGARMSQVTSTRRQMHQGRAGGKESCTSSGLRLAM